MKSGLFFFAVVFSILLLLAGCVSQLPESQSKEIPSVQANQSIQPARQQSPSQALQENETWNATEMQQPVQPLSISSLIEHNCIGFVIGNPVEFGNINLVGAGWARPHPGPFAWGTIEKTPGEYDFSATDEYVKAAQQNNVSILATIWPFPSGDQQGNPNCMVSESDEFYPRPIPGRGDIPAYRCKPHKVQAYRKFLAALVERYDGDGNNDMPGLLIPIKYWEVLNEPEMKSERLTFFVGNENDYVEVLMESYQAIRQACPDCMVVQGGAAGTQTRFLSFWENVLKAGGGNYFDVANIHYIGMGDTATLNVAPFKALLDKYNVNKSIWVTEAQFQDASADVLSSTRGALGAGASKVFFVSFQVGGLSRPVPGQYAPVYKETVKLCNKTGQGTNLSSGLKFNVIQEQGARITGSVPYAYRLENGKIRLYYCRNGIVSGISEDGLDFKEETGTRIGDGCDPTIVKNTDNNMRLYYKVSSGPGGPGVAIHDVYSAVSNDGLDFEKERMVINSVNTGDNGWASVPEAIRLPDGRIRVYYVSGDPDALGGVMSVISTNGLDFEKEKGVRVRGTLVDPAVAILSDNSYLLLVIHQCPREIGQCALKSGLYALISKDGLNFGSPELIYEAAGIFDPALLQIGNDTYRVYLGSGVPPQEMVIKSIILKILR